MAAREMLKSKSALEFVTTTISEMVEEGATLALPRGVIPRVVSPLTVVPKKYLNKLRLIVNISMSISTSQRKSFKFEGLSDIAVMAEKEDLSLSYDLISKNYHASLHPESRRFVVFIWKGIYYQYNCLPFGLSTAP